MNKRLWPVLLAMLAVGLIAAGCGDDDDDDGGSDEPATEATTDTGTDDGTDIDTGNEEVDAAVEQAVEACKQSIQATPGLSEDSIAELEDLCEEAASGDVEDAQAASVEVCRTIAEDTLPEGAARDTAIQACESLTTTP